MTPCRMIASDWCSRVATPPSHPRRESPSRSAWSAVFPPPMSHAPSSCPSRRWPRGSPVPRRRSPKHASPTGCRTGSSCPSDWTAFSPPSICSSARATPPARGTHSSGRTCATGRFTSPAHWPRCCPSRPRPAVSSVCCFSRTPAGPPAPTSRVGSCSSQIRTGHGGTSAPSSRGSRRRPGHWHPARRGASPCRRRSPASARELTANAAERAFLEHRLSEVESADPPGV